MTFEADGRLEGQGVESVTAYAEVVVLVGNFRDTSLPLTGVDRGPETDRHSFTVPSATTSRTRCVGTVRTQE